MKIAYLLRLVSLLLLCALLSGCMPVSLPSGERAQELLVEQTPPQYSEEFERETSQRVAALLSALSRRGGGPLFDQIRQNELALLVREQIFPQARELLIYESNWRGLLTACESTLTLYEDKPLSAAAFLGLLASLFEEMRLSLGEVRTGGLCYHVLLVALREKTALAEQRYEKYGYSWYLKEAQACAALTQGWQAELDGARFSAAMSVLTSFLPALRTLWREGGASEVSFALYDAELCLFLQRQATKSAAALSVAEWELIGETLALLFPSRGGTDPLSAEWRALCGCEGYVKRVFGSLPAFLRLTEAVSLQLTAADIAVLRGEGTAAARMQPILRAVLDCEAVFFALSQTLSSRLAIADARERAALESVGALADYERFAAERGSVDAQGVFAAMAALADGNVSETDTVSALSAALTDYFYGLAPYLTYVLCTAESEG